MQKRDPFSTPARRRRIIAEFSKKTLRFYCVQACINVYRFRIDTQAVLVMQCAVRKYLAKKRVNRKRKRKQRKAAIKIQSRVRIILAKKLRKRLAAALLLKRQLRLSVVVHQLRNARKQRMARIALAISLRLAREKKEKLAAINIQRVFRGFSARRLYRILYEKHQELLRLKHKSAIKVQSITRRKLAMKIFQYWMSRKRSGMIIYCAFRQWWIQRKCQRRRAAIITQRHIRGYLGRNKVIRLRQLREEEQLRAAVAIASALTIDCIDEMIIRVAKECLPHERNMNIHVDMNSEVFASLVAQGPAHMITWCLANSIIEYRNSAGYQAGAVVQQVVRSVDTALASTDVPALPVSNNNAENTSSSTADGSSERVIALAQWDEGEATDTPSADQLPVEWGQLCYRHIDKPVGAAVSVSYIERSAVELHIATVAYARSQFLRTTVTIIFNCSTDSPTPASASSSNTNAATSGVEGGARTVNELKFRFKNALVYVNAPASLPPSPPKLSSPLPELLPVETPEAEVEDSRASDGEGESDDENSIEDASTEEVQRRPSKAVVRIVLREPTPPPAPIDYDAHACVLQKLLRKRLQLKHSMARRIQQTVRRSRYLFTWQELVYSVLEVAQDAATIIQCWGRRSIARRRLAELREAHFRAHYGHDFAVDEEQNWAAFGLPLPLQTQTQDFTETVYRNMLGFVPSSLLFQEDSKKQAYEPPPAGAVLQLLDYPAPLPGCLFQPPSRSEGAEEGIERGSSTGCALTLLRLPETGYLPSRAATEETGTQQTAAAGVAAVGETGWAGMVQQAFPTATYEGSVRHRVLRPYYDEYYTETTTSSIHTTAANDTATMEAVAVPVISAVDGTNAQHSAIDSAKYHAEHLGNIVLDSMESPIDATILKHLHCNSHCSGMEHTERRKFTAENAAPVYKLFARNL